MSASGSSTKNENWKHLPLHQILFEWTANNISMPTDISVIVAYVALFLIAWYVFVTATRFIMTIIWPLLLIGSAIVAFYILRSYEPEDIAIIIEKLFTRILDTVVSILLIFLNCLGKIMENLLGENVTSHANS